MGIYISFNIKVKKHVVDSLCNQGRNILKGKNNPTQQNSNQIMFVISLVYITIISILVFLSYERISSAEM